MPVRGRRELVERRGVHRLLCRADRRLQGGGVGLQRRILFEFGHPDVARAAIVVRFGADRELHVEQLRIAGHRAEPFVQHFDAPLVLLHLPQLLRDAETLLRVARLSPQLPDVRLHRLERVALLHVALCDVLEGSAVERIALQGALGGRDDAVRREPLRFVNRRDAQPRARRVGLERQRLLCLGPRARELSLLAFFIAVADRLAHAHGRSDALGDDLGECRRGSGIAVGGGEAAGDAGAADVDHLDIGTQRRTVLQKGAGHVRVHLEEARQLFRLLIIEQAIARKSRLRERFAQFRLRDHHHLALHERVHAITHGIGQRDARGRVAGQSLERQDQQAHGRLLRLRKLLRRGRRRYADRQGHCELKRSHRGRSSVTGCYTSGRRGIRTPDILRVRQAL